MKPRISLSLLIVLLVLAAGCTPASSSDPSSAGNPNELRAWFDAPLPETVFWPPNPCVIVGHGASPNGIAAFELTINGTATSLPSTDTQSSLVTLTRSCALTEPGRYVLLLRAQDNAGNWSGFAQTSLIIGGRDASTPLPSLPPLATIPPESVTFPATVTLPAASITLEEKPYDVIYIGAASCGPLEIPITVHAVAPNGIQVVVLFYRFETGNSSSGFESIAMNPIGGDRYQRILNPTSLLGGIIPFDFATLQYQVVVQQANGDTTLRTPVMADISVQACGSTTNACSTYTTRQDCLAHGCRWVGGGTSFTCQP